MSSPEAVVLAYNGVVLVWLQSHFDHGLGMGNVLLLGLAAGSSQSKLARSPWNPSLLLHWKTTMTCETEVVDPLRKQLPKGCDAGLEGLHTIDLVPLVELE
jgi:hypothetical protein